MRDVTKASLAVGAEFFWRDVRSGAGGSLKWWLARLRFVSAMEFRSLSMQTNTKKSIGAVVAGVVTIIVATTAVDIALHAAGVFPPMDQPLTDSLAVVASSYRLLISIGGAYLTARLAPNRPLYHAVLLGCVGTVLGLIGAIATWNLGLGPRWYPVSLVVLALPQCWVGGKLYEMRASAAKFA